MEAFKCEDLHQLCTRTRCKLDYLSGRATIIYITIRGCCPQVSYFTKISSTCMDWSVTVNNDVSLLGHCLCGLGVVCLGYQWSPRGVGSYWWFIMASIFASYGHGIPEGGRVSLVSMNSGYFHNQHF